MTNYDFTPLFRTAIGFDRLARTLESANREEAGNYPPYNIAIEDEDCYRITLAVAGFTRSDLEIEVKENTIKISGNKKGESDQHQYLHRGIALRGFERTFQLADYVKVVNAGLQDGLLHIVLRREIPETMKPRKIAIETASSKRLLDGDAKDEI